LQKEFKRLKGNNKNTKNNYTEAWKKFDNSLNIIKEKYSDFNNYENLEFLLTMISLLEKNHHDNYLALCEKEEISSMGPEHNLYQAYRDAKNGFVECLKWSFQLENSEMQKDTYRYLHVFFEKFLSAGDTVITTNYDLLAERTLHDLNLWYPTDGYGFSRTFKYFSFPRGESIRELAEQELSECNSKNSQVKVFKLHGSVNWLEDNDDIVLDHTSLQHILPQSQYMCDINYQGRLHVNSENILILPTYIKAYAQKTLLDIWSQAMESIQNATEIHIIGFSLPEYDANIRTILLPLRNNLMKGKCCVKVYIKKLEKKFKKKQKEYISDKATIERWENFLCKKAEIIEIDSFKKYVEGGLTLI
jgi:uncharacterized protein YbgA (DUF1722 family)